MGKKWIVNRECKEDGMKEKQKVLRASRCRRYRGFVSDQDCFQMELAGRGDNRRRVVRVERVKRGTKKREGKGTIAYGF